MYILETLTTLGTQDTERRQTKQNTTHKAKKMGNTKLRTVTSSGPHTTLHCIQRINHVR